MKNFRIVLIIALVITLVSCNNEVEETGSDIMLRVVTTTTMITDLAHEIGGDDISIHGLMGAGVDPHLYKATAGDVAKLGEADAIFYNGLHLEGKLVDVFEKMNHKKNITYALSDCLDKSTLISSENFASSYDPHIWFDVHYWMQMTEYMTEKLIELDPIHKEGFEKRRDEYLHKLEVLDADTKKKLNKMEPSKRILVTAHDAFNYFGKLYSFQVVGLQGLSTATEAGVKDLQDLSKFIIDNDVKSIFIESSVPRRTIEALQASVNSKGHKVTIGGELYSDALGDAGSIEGTYIGMYNYNVNTILKSLR